MAVKITWKLITSDIHWTSFFILKFQIDSESYVLFENWINCYKTDEKVYFWLIPENMEIKSNRNWNKSIECKMHRKL